MLEKFVKKLSKNASVLLLCHAGADVDSLSCAIALFESLSFSTAIGFPDHLGKNAVELAKNLKIKTVQNPLLSKFDAVILLDFNSVGHAGTLGSELNNFKKPILILDHHQKESDSPKTPFVLIDPSALAASLVVFE